jgi:DNA replication protein DnaC
VASYIDRVDSETPPDRAAAITRSGDCSFGACDGSGFVVDEQTNTASDCRCRSTRISRARSRSLSQVIPRKYRGVSFDRPPVTEIAPAVTQAVRAYVRHLDENLDSGRGLWFFGGVGTGKTTLAMLVSQAALQAGRSVAIYSLPRLLAEIRTTFDDSSQRSYTELLDRLAAVDLLHVDDVGAEKTSPWVLEQLYALVNARYEEERSVVITTNLERGELAEQINERTVSRLEEMCDVLPLWGADARQYRPDAAGRRTA